MQDFGPEVSSEMAVCSSILGTISVAHVGTNAFCCAGKECAALYCMYAPVQPQTHTQRVSEELQRLAFAFDKSAKALRLIQQKNISIPSLSFTKFIW